MNKRTMKFHSVGDMAKFSKLLSAGFLMNTINKTITAIFTEEEIRMAIQDFDAIVIDTTEKVFSYHSV